MERRVRLASMKVMGLGVVGSYLLVWVLNEFLFSSESVRGLTRSSFGWVNPNLPFFLIMTLVIVGGIVFGWGRMRAVDVGLSRSQWRTGVAVFLGLWLSIQLLALFLAGGPQWHPAWRDPGAGYVLGLLIAMLLGTALFEETFFRGFLLPQLYLRLGWIRSELMRLLTATLGSALVFAPWHLPTLLINQELDIASLLLRLLNLVGAGLLLGLLYLRTGNLWVVMAVHALVNAPTLMFASPVPGSVLAGSLGVVLILFWPWFGGRRLAAPLMRFRSKPVDPS